MIFLFKNWLVTNSGHLFVLIKNISFSHVNELCLAEFNWWNPWGPAHYGCHQCISHNADESSYLTVGSCPLQVL